MAGRGGPTPGDFKGRAPYRRGPIGTSGAPRPPGNPESRLYVGNLDRRVNEGNVLKLFSQFGGLKRCDYMWHTNGPLRGQPRGFAFIEFDTLENAGKAQSVMNGKVVAGRPMVVHFAEEKVHVKNDAPLEALMKDRLGSTGMGSGTGSVASTGVTDPGSALAPAAPAGNPHKAALADALRRKLAQMEKEDP